MSSLFDAKSEAFMLKTLGEKSVYSVLQRDFSDAIQRNKRELSIVNGFAKKIRGSVRAARTSTFTIFELAQRSDIVLNARLP